MGRPESRIDARHTEAEPVTIVGAGPASLATAIALVRGGRHVAVCEWHRYIGPRFHGNFQGLENWSDERDESVGTIPEQAFSHGSNEGDWLRCRESNLRTAEFLLLGDGHL